jgi:G3E family GTPase
MHATIDSRIPICLVTGFLGAGKTTFLKFITRRHIQRRLIYLVNEFSPRDIDGAIVSESNPDVVSVPGGSIFCKCLVTEFMAQLQAIPARYGKPEGLIIEASGMANPSVMASMLEETGLASQYRLARIISVVDPGSFHKLRQTLPNIIAQIQSADLALINKSDLYAEHDIQATRDALQEINSDIEILPCSHGEADINLFTANADKSVIPGAGLAACRDPLYDTVTLTPATAITPELLQVRLAEVEADIYRLKGYLGAEENSTYVDYSKSGFTATPAGDQHKPVIVLIHAGSPSESTRAFIEWLRKTP